VRRVLAAAGGPDGVRRDVYVEGDTIVGVEPAGTVPNGWEVVECGRLWVLPGLVDLCAHLPSRPEAWREDAATLAAAALAGGFTTVCCVTGEYRPDALAPWRDAPLRLLPVAAATRGGRLCELDALRRAGAVAYSDDPRPIADAGLMRRVLQYAELPVAVHAEDPSLAAGGVAHEGTLAGLLGLPGIPAEAETVAVARDLLLAAATGRRLHFAHLSTAGAVAAVRRAKEAGLPVTAAVAVHHLVCSEAAVRGYDPAARLSPPLRAEADREALVQGVIDGTLDAVVSDHTACAPEDKDVPFAEAAPGAAALELCLAAALAALPPAVAVAALSERAARVFGLAAGRLAAGSPADLVLVDPEASWVVDPARFRGRGRHTPLQGRRLRGRVVATMAGGVLHKHTDDGIISTAKGA
jgi:dihydroorotase